MGEMADYFLEQEMFWDIDEALNETARLYIVEEIEALQDAGKWKTIDGRIYLLSEMCTSHINNTIALLERSTKPDTYGLRERWLRMFYKEQRKRPDRITVSPSILTEEI